MRTDLDHLPDAKRRELERVIEILFEEFGDATGQATGKRRLGRILKTILFGSYARGGWLGARVEELGRAVQELCLERLDELRRGIEP